MRKYLVNPAPLPLAGYVALFLSSRSWLRFKYLRGMSCISVVSGVRMRALLACRRESSAGPQGGPSADRKGQCSEGGRDSWAGPELTRREREEELGKPLADWKGECDQLA